jgi:hypothetical protein
MFCPTCGRDNSFELKFCASCGTNLEAISRALSVSEEGLFTKVDKSLDQFIARYAEHVFKDAPIRALDRQISKSWQVLGQGALTSLFDLALFTIMTIVLPIKFFILLIYTPVRLLSERSKHRMSTPAEVAGRKAHDLFDPLPQQWLPESVASITEHTTMNLGNSGVPKKKARLNTDPLSEDRT